MVVSSPLLDALDYLSQIDANQNQLLIGAFILLVTGIACAGIAIALYPVLQKNSPGLALGLSVSGLSKASSIILV